MSKIYESIRKIKGKSERNICILQSENQTFSTIPEIADKLASSFSQVSSSINYRAEFQTTKITEENKILNFSSINEKKYNLPFIVEDLLIALSKVKHTSPGPDKIHYQMLKNMPPWGKIYLTKLFNKFWFNGYYPEEWREAIVIALPKPNKYPSNPENYRLVALTSCPCRTIER